MFGYDGHRGAVYYLAVRESFRGQGIARKLMAQIEDELTTIGCPKINLFIRAENQAVQALYESLGYELETSMAMGKRLIVDG